MAPELLTQIGEYLESLRELTHVGTIIRASGGQPPDELLGRYYLRNGYPLPPGLRGPGQHGPERREQNVRAVSCPPHPSAGRSRNGSWRLELRRVFHGASELRSSVSTTFDTPRGAQLDFNQDPANEDYSRIPYDFSHLATATASSLRTITRLDLTHSFFERTDGEHELPPLAPLSQRFIVDLLRLCVNLEHLTLPHPSHLHAINFPTQLRSLGVAKRGPASPGGFSLRGRFFPVLQHLEVYGFSTVAVLGLTQLRALAFHARPGSNTLNLDRAPIEALTIHGPQTISRRSDPFDLSIENLTPKRILRDLTVYSIEAVPQSLFQIPPALLQAANNTEVESVHLEGVEIPQDASGRRNLDLRHAQGGATVRLISCRVDDVTLGRNADIRPEYTNCSLANTIRV